MVIISIKCAWGDKMNAPYELELSTAHTPRALQPLQCSVASTEALHSELELYCAARICIHLMTW